MRQRVAESEEWHGGFFEKAPIAYYWVGGDGRIVQANNHAAELFGCPLQPPLERDLRDSLRQAPVLA